ncbi:nuclear transport factor 2 family protein [Novosphingobium sp.]|uniref:nuclear transport factor 2 family protein n=1 Tax=Novosphingobium sp. TaxID=1874826 RepID=UPI002FE3E07F
MYQIADQIACSNLLVQASYLGDLHKVEEFIALFTEDASLERLGDPFRGVEAIRGFMLSRKRERRTRHVVSPPIITFVDADNAHGVALYTLFDGTENSENSVLPVSMPATVGEFHQTYRRVNGEWKIVSHNSVAIFRRV